MGGEGASVLTLAVQEGSWGQDLEKDRMDLGS